MKTRVVSVTVMLAVMLTAATGCKKDPMEPIAALRDAELTRGEDGAKELAIARALPACTPPFTTSPPEGCLADLARGFGGKHGFRSKEPDHATAASVALLLLRERRGDWVQDADTWLGLVRKGGGPGSDALRMALLLRLADIAPRLGKRWDSEQDVTLLLADIGTSIPGACPTYTALATGAAASTFPPGAAPETSPCVQHDLERREGPGATYGYGIFRAAEGAVALCRSAAAALRVGKSVADAKTKAAIEEQLPRIEESLAHIELKKVVSGSEATLKFLTDAHKQAGIEIGGYDAGAPHLPEDQAAVTRDAGPRMLLPRPF